MHYHMIPSLHCMPTAFAKVFQFQMELVDLTDRFLHTFRWLLRLSLLTSREWTNLLLQPHPEVELADTGVEEEVSLLYRSLHNSRNINPNNHK